MGIAWDEQVPEGAISERRVFRVRPGDKHFVWLLGGITGVWLHWVGERTIPCFGRNCPHCTKPKIWKGYCPAVLAITDPISGRPRFAEEVCLEISSKAASVLHGMKLRGLVVVVSREKKDRASVQVEIAETQYDKPPPPAFDVRTILCRLWRVSQSQALPEEPRIYREQA